MLPIVVGTAVEKEEINLKQGSTFVMKIAGHTMGESLSTGVQVSGSLDLS